ncbi:MAG: hypothetical protein IJ745_05085 [Bacteroidales bacterium]|nr:hypothetical protein [Bacteroidales bacterium]
MNANEIVVMMDVVPLPAGLSSCGRQDDSQTATPPFDADVRWRGRCAGRIAHGHRDDCCDLTR